MALLVQEICSWPAKTTKKLNFLRCKKLGDLFLKCCLDLNKGSWVQLPFYFLSSVNVVVSFFGKIFISVVDQVLSRSSLVFQCCAKVCNWFQKPFGREWFAFLQFLVWNMPRFVNSTSALTNLFENWSNCIVICSQQIFSVVSLRGILVCTLYVPALFSHTVF